MRKVTITRNYMPNAEGSCLIAVLIVILVQTNFTNLEAVKQKKKDIQYTDAHNFYSMSPISFPKTATDWKEKERIFKDKTGLEGTFHHSVFWQPIDPLHGTTKSFNTIVKGNFPLPAPNDSISFTANTDFLVKSITDLYQFGGEPYTMQIDKKSFAYNDFIKGYRWMAMYYQLFDGDKLYLQSDDTKSHIKIYYDRKDNSYTIGVTMPDHPFIYPKIKVTKEEAIKLATQHLNQDFPQATEVQTPTVSKRMMLIYDKGKANRYYLRLAWVVHFSEKKPYWYVIDTISGKTEKDFDDFNYRDHIH
jgi:hypothetical protein